MMRHTDGHRPKGLYLALALAALVAMFSLAACGSDDESSSTSSSTAGSSAPAESTPLNDIFGPGGKDGGADVKVNTGMLLAVTGAGAYFGRVMSQGAKLAASQIKASGGPEFDITVKDHKNGSIPAGVAGVRQLISEKKIDWLQTSYGAVSEAIIPLIQQSKTLTFNGGGTSPGQVGKDYLWNNRMLFGEAPGPGQLAYIAKAYPDVKNLAVIGTEENAVTWEKEGLPAAWAKLMPGGKITTEIVDAGLTNFGPAIARIKAANPDAIIGELFGNDPGYFTKQLRQKGVTVPFINSEFTTDACKVGGAAYDTFMFGHDYFDPDSENPFAQEFVKGFQEEYNATPDFYAANYYEQEFVMWNLIRAVLKKGGDPTDSTQLQEALVANPTFPSVYAGGPGKVGEMTFDTKLHTIVKPMGIFTVKDCKATQVATIKTVGPNDDPSTALVSIDK